MSVDHYARQLLVEQEYKQKPGIRHQHISFFKSAIRLLGYLLLWPISIGASFVLIISEIIGIMEEIGHD
jgi:hypothetical protein